MIFYSIEGELYSRYIVIKLFPKNLHISRRFYQQDSFMQVYNSTVEFMNNDKNLKKVFEITP